MRRLASFLASCALIGLLAGPTVGTVAAQDDSLASHPIVGAWMLTTPGGIGLVLYHADGTVSAAYPSVGASPEGVSFVSPQLGAWEPTGERSLRTTGIWLFSDAEGTFTGTVTFNGYVSVSEDGQSIMSDDGGMVTIRDAENNILQEFPAGAGDVTGTRIRAGSPGFPEAPPPASSPAP